MFIHLNKKILIPNCSHLRCIAWSSEHEFISCGGDNGMLKVIKLENQHGATNNNNPAASSSSSTSSSSSSKQNSKNLSINQTLDSHKTTVENVCWNEKYQKLTSKDASGTIIVWMFYKGMWYEEMVNNRQKSQVTGMAWTHDGTKICIVYEDGAVITGSVDGSRLWGKEMKSINLNQVEWSPDGKIILIGTRDLEIHVFDCSGNFLKKILPNRMLSQHQQQQQQNRQSQKSSSSSSSDKSDLIGIKWFKNSINLLTRPLLVAMDDGQVLLMKNESDQAPWIVQCEMRITSIEWNHMGDMFAVTGMVMANGSANSSGSSKNYLNIYNDHGTLLSMIKVPGNEIYDCSWEKNGLKLVLAVDSYMYFVSLKPGVPWCWLGSSIVFLRNNYKDQSKTLVFWELRTNKPYESKLNNYFLQMASWNHYCVVVIKVDHNNSNVDHRLAGHQATSSNEDDDNANDNTDGDGQKMPKKTMKQKNDLYCLNLYNSSGTLIDYHLTELEVKHCCMNSTRVIVTTNDSYFIWPFKPLFNANSFKNSHSETLYNELTNNNNTIIMDHGHLASGKSSSQSQSQPTIITSNDKITCICSSEKYFMVGFDSGTINQYLLPNASHIGKISMDGGIPTRMALNKNSTKLALLDKTSKFLLYDFEASNDDDGWSEGKWIDVKLNEIWDFKWDTDHSDLLVVLEKNKLIMINLHKTIQIMEPLPFQGHICQFSQLTIKTIQLDQLIVDMRMSDNQQQQHRTLNINDYMDTIECPPVKTLKDLIDKESITDAINLALQATEMPSMWNILSQESLKNLDIETAYLAMVKCKDYKGLQFIKRLNKFNDENLKRAEINAYFNQFEEAETIYLQLDRPELALNLYKTVGNYQKVMDLLRKYNLPHHEKETDEAHKNLAEYYADHNDWANAIQHYEKIDAYDRLVECYINEERYDSLIAMIDKLNDEKTLLVIGRFLETLGFCRDSVKAYLKANHFEMAIQACVNLSEWKLATELADQYKTKNVDLLLEKYVQHLEADYRYIEMIEVYKKANRIDEANAIIMRLIDEIRTKRNDNVMMLKKLHVLIGIMHEESRKSNDASTAKSTTTLDELLLSSQNDHDFSASNGPRKTIEDPWKGAEAYHFYMLTQRYLYRNKYDSAMNAALHLQNYEEYLTMEQIYSMIALCAYANKCWDVCSKAFIKLESLGMEQKWNQWINDLMNNNVNHNNNDNDNVTTMENGETSSNISEEKRRNEYERLAVKIFLKNPPNSNTTGQTDGETANATKNVVVKRNCKFCNESIPEYSIVCGNCHTKFPACVASGQSLMDHRKNWTCKRCGHHAIRTEISSFNNCPLCHYKID